MGDLFAAGDWAEVFKWSPYTEWYLNSWSLEGSPTEAHHAATMKVTVGEHALTPSTPTSCYWHTIYMRNYLLGNAALSDRIHQMTVEVQEEDKAVIEAQQRMLLDEPERAVLDLASDAAQAQGRRLIRRSA